MRILLDTHVLLWSIMQSTRIDGNARTAIESTENEVFFSAANVWEIAIKTQAQRLRLPISPEDLARAARAAGFAELPIDSEAAGRVATLPMHHRDPFDRILIAQAMAMPARLFTVDKKLVPYSDLITLI